MTDDERAKLERAKEHPACREAMGREPADYTLPALAFGLFYLLVPMVFLVPFMVAATDELGVVMMASMTALYALWSTPFLIAAARLYRLRKLPVARWLGMLSAEAPTRTPGRWIRLERLDEGAIELRLRMRAYLEFTGGAAAPGTIGVAMCKGDQVVEWVLVPDAPTG